MDQDIIQQINSRLQRIANVLILNASFTDNLGLLNGKMGIAIFFYHYARYTGNKTYENFAGELIDEIYEEINYGTPADFANGLTGIGWGIEYLVKNGFVEADRDETLKEIDNGVFGASLRMPVMISNQNDILGFGLYYLSRLYGREQIEDDISILHLKQILIYLVDDCERLLVHKKFLDVNIPFLNTAQLNSILYYLLEIHRLELFPVKVGKLFHYLPSHIEMLVDKNDDWADKQTLLQFIAKLMKLVSEAGLKNQFRKIARLISNMDLQNENDEAFINQITRLNWHKLVYTVDFTSNKNLGKLSEKAMAIVNDEENWNQRLDKLNKDNLGLNNGLAGLGLALLNEIRKCNNEEMKELKNEKIAV